MTLPIPSHLKVRDARDRLIDLLGIGQTYPLRDVEVQDEELTVNFKGSPVIDIQPGQSGVKYELYDQDQFEAVGAQYRADGTGDKTVLTGPPITKDSTFSILATKLAHPERSTFLWQSAPFKVGLNNQLRAFTPTAKELNRDSDNPTDAEPGVVNWGSRVTIWVVDSQLGAQYSLGYTDGDGKPVTTSPVNGTMGVIELLTEPLTEDAQLRINVSRTFAPAEGRANLTAVLSTVITLAVRANPKLAVELQGAARDGLPLVDPLGAVTLTVTGSQKSVTYSAYLRRLLDADFEFLNTSKAELIAVSIPRSVDVPAHLVYVNAPTVTPPFTVESGYAQQGDVSPGNGAVLTLNLGQIHDDSVVVVQAKKTHSGGPLRESVVRLTQPAVALPRPDPAPTLTLTAGGDDTMLVTNGQRGVFYHFRLPPSDVELGAPAYFHRLDEVDAQQNRGITQLRIEADFVVTRPPPTPGADLARQLPLAPLVELLQVPAATSVTAVWARTGVAWTLARTIPINKT